MTNKVELTRQQAAHLASAAAMMIHNLRLEAEQQAGVRKQTSLEFAKILEEGHDKLADKFNLENYREREARSVKEIERMERRERLKERGRGRAFGRNNKPFEA